MSKNSLLWSPVDPIVGIIRSLYELEIYKSDPEVFVVTAQLSDISLHGLKSNAVLNGSAAGLQKKSAYWAAIGEACERYASCIVDPANFYIGSYLDLSFSGLNPIKPDRWALFDEQQYGAIPYQKFTQDTQIAWTDAENLTRREDCLVPACLSYLSHPEIFTAHDAQIIGNAVSTGTACSYSRADAMVRGICEIIERDAFIITWRNKLSAPRVIIDESSSIFQTFAEKFQRTGLEYYLFYTTLDIKIPSFFGILLDKRDKDTRLIVGGAAHLDADVAVLKTLTELVQGLKWLDSMRNNSVNLIKTDIRDIRSFEDRFKFYSSTFLPHVFEFLLSNKCSVNLSDLKSCRALMAESSLNLCKQILAERNMDVIGIDLTSGDLECCGLYVVKMLIPEMQPLEGDYQAQFLGGKRWKEVPVNLGMTQKPLNIEDINPWPHPYP